MRLIDADELLTRIRLNYNNHQKVSAGAINDIIGTTKTAYDVEKVVAELEKASFLMEPRTEGHYADNGVFLDEAIKIVRKGGAE